VPPINRPWWEQVTALVSLSVSGALTGFSFVPKAPAELKSPSGMPIHLMALQKAAQPAQAGDAALRSAIINVTNYFLRMAGSKTPAQMEAIIWHHASIDGVDHGESCAAFASLTLQLAAHAVGQQSWATGGTSYPWPLHKWADVRVGPNPGSLGIVSVLQDAEAHHRWHPLGDGYTPLPGDWVLFDGHVEVVTKYTGGALQTVGGDSLPNFSVNAHTYPGPLAGQGVVGFVNNGDVPGMGSTIAGSGDAVSGSQANQTSPAPHQHHSGGGQSAHGGGKASLAAAGQQGHHNGNPAGHAGRGPSHGVAAEGRSRIPGAPRSASARLKVAHAQGGAAVPGLPVRALGPQPKGHLAPHLQHPDKPGAGQARATTASRGAGPGGTAIPGLPATAAPPQGTAKTAEPPAAPTGALSPPSPSPYGRHQPPPPPAAAYGSHAEQAFINEIAPWAMAAQRRYGVPASVTIAQAIDESGWGQSVLATADHNLFGIKGTGPAGTVVVPATEYQNGQLVDQASSFRVYHNIAESVDDHGKLLATSQYYRQAMADRHNPNAFAAALTGIYATDPQYGSKLVDLMQRYDLYRYDMPSPASTAHRPTPGSRPRAGAPKPRAHVATPGPTHTAAPHTPDPRPTPGSNMPTTMPGVGPNNAVPSPAPDPVIPGLAPPGGQSSPTRNWWAPGGGARTLPRDPAQRAAPPADPGQGTPGRAGPRTGGLSGPPSSGVPGGASDSSAATQQQYRAAPVAPRVVGPGSAPPTSVATATPASAAPRGTNRPAQASPAQHPAAPNTAPQTTPPTADPPPAQHAPAPGRTTHSAVPQQAPRGTAPQSPARRTPTRPGTAGGAAIPGVPATDASTQVSGPRQARADVPSAAARLDAFQAEPAAVANNAQPSRQPSPLDWQKQKIASRRTSPSGRRYQHHIPPSVWTALVATARGRLLGEEPLYRDVASHTGIRWELLAACDWMQCKARTGYSPVQGEKLGTVNADGTIYHTKSEALRQCAEDLAELAGNVYRLDLAAPGELSVCELANVFAAFRWGGLLRLHYTSAMEFPYSVAGLTVQQTNMRWPKIDEPNAPDKPGSRFRMPFGAVPVVLSLNYPATI